MSENELNELCRCIEGERRRQAAEQSLIQHIQTTLSEYPDACHEHLFPGLSTQDKKSSAEGNLAKAEHKLRPSKIKEWTDFPDE